MTSGQQEEYLHPDLVREILLRLPAKSVVKFRSVSKLWSSMTSHPCFIRSFSAKSSKSPCLLIVVENMDKLFLFSVPQHQSSNNDNHMVVQDSYAMTYPKGSCFSSVQSIHGLIFVSVNGNPQIMNPSTRHFSTLPKPYSNQKNRGVAFLGYDPVDRTYKLLSMTSGGYGDNHLRHPRALTLGGAQGWRDIQDVPGHATLGYGAQCISGVLYYIASAPIVLEHPDRCLMSFHVRSEKLTMMIPPWNTTPYKCYLISYEGKLVTVLSDGDDLITLWTLEDAEKEQWSYKHLRLPFTCNDRVLKTRFKLYGVNEAGEFIYVPWSHSRTRRFHIIYFDPKRNSFRRVVVEGVADDQFRLQNGYGFGNKYFCIHSAYSNHTETLVSF